MKVGDLVQIQRDGHPWSPAHFGESRYIGMRGVIIEDHSPQRPARQARVMDVMWESGEIEDMYTQDLELINESR